MPDLGDCDVVELRRYLLHPGRFDDLQEVFQRWLVDGQERDGMRLGGQFRDRGNPDRFVWFRGFTSMAQRREALESFYSGPVWAAHKDAANPTMIDSDDVLLLRPTDPPHRPRPPGPRAPGGGAPDRVVAQVLTLPDGADLEGWLAGPVHGVLERALGVPVAMWRTEPSPNTFPRLPVREGAFAVWLAVFRDEEHWTRAAARLADDADWRRATGRLTDAGVTAEWLHLEPTATSAHPAPTELSGGEDVR